MTTLETIAGREPALARLLEMLQKLPRFDPTKAAQELQGDLPEVQEAENLYHSFNTRFQSAKVIEGKRVVVRQPVLQELFKLADWQNLQKLISHSTKGRTRKKAANLRYRGKQKQDDPEAWLNLCRKKRRDRLTQWERENHPRLLRSMAEAEQAVEERAKKRLRCEVLNELEARYTNCNDAEFEFLKLQYRVLLGLLTQTQSVAVHARLLKLAKDLWESPEQQLKLDIAKGLPAILTDWSIIERAMEHSVDVNYPLTVRVPDARL